MNSESLLTNGSFWFPRLVESSAGGVDLLFWGVFWVSVLISVVIIGVVTYFAWKYRRRPGHEVATGMVIHNAKLEVAWTVIPLVLTMVLFAWGLVDFLKLTVAPTDSYEIRVTARKWGWTFEHPSGVKTDNVVVVPKDRNVRFLMSSIDVLHAMYIPNLRRQMDVIPYRYTSVWFRAEHVGKYQIFCAQYCGGTADPDGGKAMNNGHSTMLAVLEVVPAGDFQDYLKKAAASANVPLDELGEKLFQSKGCVACHSVDGSRKVGPTLKALFGSSRPLEAGGAVTADESYLAESILKPAAKIAAGFPNVMPSYDGQLSEREVAGLIAYIKKNK